MCAYEASVAGDSASAVSLSGARVRFKLVPSVTCVCAMCRDLEGLKAWEGKAGAVRGISTGGKQGWFSGHVY